MTDRLHLAVALDGYGLNIVGTHPIRNREA